MLSSLKWNEMKKVHSNLRRIQAVLSNINTCTYSLLDISFPEFMRTRNKGINLSCGFTMHLTGYPVSYKVRHSCSFNHATCPLLKNLHWLLMQILSFQGGFQYHQHNMQALSSKESSYRIALLLIRYLFKNRQSIHEIIQKSISSGLCKTPQKNNQGWVHFNF